MPINPNTIRWDSPAPQAPAPAAPRAQQAPTLRQILPPQPQLPTPMQVESNDRDRIRTDIAVRGEGRQVANTEFDQVTRLRDDYNADPTVKAYRVAIQQLGQAISTGEGPQNDLALTYAFAKAMDPDSVVRESEQGMVTDSQPWFQSAVENVKKQFGMDGAGNYTPEARRAIREQIASAVAQRNKLYHARRQYFREFADQYGFDPQYVIGEHDGQPFLPGLEQFQREGEQGTQNAPRTGTGQQPAPDAEPPNYWPGVVGEDGKPLPPEGGYGRDPETGEWGLYGRVTDTSAPTPAETEAARLNELQGEMGITDLAGQGMTLGFSDEAAGVGTMVGRALTGDFDFSENYRLGRDAARLRLDDARERLGGAGTAAEIAGGGALGKVGGGLSQLLAAGRSAAVRGAPAARGTIQSQLARIAAGEGAMVGGTGGFGYGEGLQDSSANAFLGAGVGGALGFAGQRVGNALANRSRATASAGGAAVQRAADDLQIPLIPAVTGGTTTRRVTSGARQGFISDRPISRAVNAMEAGGDAARNRTAAQAGRVLDSEDAGNVVRQAANVYSRRTSDIGGRLYDRADNMAGGLQLPLPRAVAAADAWLAKLAKSVDGANGTLYRDVKSLRDKMAAGQFEIEGIRQTRTTLREQLQERGLRGSVTDKVMGDILDAASDDLFDGLTTAGKQNAAGALRTANAFWKKRVETIDEVLEPVLGKGAPRSGEQIVSSIEALAKPKTGNAARLRQLFDAMPANEARSVAATVISRMGQPTPGAAEKGAGFSFNTFLTNWNNLSPRAREAMFSPEVRESLDKLATVARGVKQAGSSANTSNTAGALGVQAMISTPLLWLAEPLTVLAATGGQWTVGRLLASPRFARWLAGAPRNPAARAQYAARLGGLARAEPAIANEIGLFERALRASNDNAATVTGIAAQEPDGDQR